MLILGGAIADAMLANGGQPVSGTLQYDRRANQVRLNDGRRHSVKPRHSHPAAFLVAIISYLAVHYHPPVVSQILDGVSVIIYGLYRICRKCTSRKHLISATVTGLGSFILGIPLTPQIARICGPRMADMEAQLE
jgi:hypothetical protein